MADTGKEGERGLQAHSLSHSCSQTPTLSVLGLLSVSAEHEHRDKEKEKTMRRREAGKRGAKRQMGAEIEKGKL